MADRVSELICAHIRIVIDGLGVPKAVKDEAEYEVVPFMAPNPANPREAELHYLIGIGLPDHGTGDHQMPFMPVEDPHDLTEIGSVTRRLFTQAQEQLAEAALARSTPSNGRRSPSGLYLD